MMLQRFKFTGGHDKPHASIQAVLATCAWLLMTVWIIAAASPVLAEDFCKPGQNYDRAKGLCYDPGTAYKADIPKAENTTGGILGGLGESLGLGGALSLCQYGDKHVGSGDQAYCVSRRTGQAYPAGR